MKSTIIITLFISLLFFLKINNTLNCFDRKTKSEISFCSDKSDFSDYYQSIHLESLGLSEDAFQKAMTGFLLLKSEKRILNNNIIKIGRAHV